MRNQDKRIIEVRLEQAIQISQGLEAGVDPAELPPFEESSGNIYADLGFDDPEMELNRAELARKINALIEARNLTQVAAAKVLGLDQPKVSAIRRGQLTGFSVERLITLLARLDQNLRNTVEPEFDSQAGGCIEVVTRQ